ncbi:MAG TPA: hypothetical protein PKD00_00350 [Burkholderiales bacterium]|mgnify:CR=1 FL=1|nr:hypothetical protein [Burkholderiales bacterium]
MENCVNISSREFLELQNSININKYILAAKIKLWQDKNGYDKFPDAKEIIESGNVNYALKILSSFTNLTERKNKLINDFNLNKISAEQLLSNKEFAITKYQQDLFKPFLVGNSLEEALTSFAYKYVHVIKIAPILDNSDYSNYDNFIYNGLLYFYNEEENKFYKDIEEISNKEYDRVFDIVENINRKDSSRFKALSAKDSNNVIKYDDTWNYTERQIVSPFINNYDRKHTTIDSSAISWFRYWSKGNTAEVNLIQSDIYQDRDITLNNDLVSLIGKNWLKFSLESIIDYMSKKNIVTLRFPLGDNSLRIQNYNLKKEQLASFIKDKEKLETYYNNPLEDRDNFNILTIISKYMNLSHNDTSQESLQYYIDSINYDIKNIEESILSLEKGVYNFYEEVIPNTLKKLGYNLTIYTDEVGNNWFETDISKASSNKEILFQDDVKINILSQEEIEEGNKLSDKIADLIIENIANRENKTKEELLERLQIITNSEDDLVKDKKGGIIRYKNKSIILLSKLSDPTTLLHELAHEFERDLTNDEINTVLNWTNHKSWTTETSELFARGFEKYLYEGEVDNKEMESLFKKFAQFLQKLIQDFTTYFKGVPELNNDIRNIYNNMIVKNKKNNNKDIEESLNKLANFVWMNYPDITRYGSKEDYINFLRKDRTLLDKYKNLETFNTLVKLGAFDIENESSVTDPTNGTYIYYKGLNIEFINRKLKELMKLYNKQQEALNIGNTLVDQIKENIEKNNYDSKDIDQFKSIDKLKTLLFYPISILSFFKDIKNTAELQHIISNYKQKYPDLIDDLNNFRYQFNWFNNQVKEFNYLFLLEGEWEKSNEGFKNYMNNQFNYPVLYQDNQSNLTLEEGLKWAKEVMPNANIEFVQGLIDNIANGSFNEVEDLIRYSIEYANKGTVKHEVGHRAFYLLSKEEQESLLDEGSKLFNIPRGESKTTIKYSQEQEQQVNYAFKLVDNIQKNLLKAHQWFKKLEDTDKFWTKLQKDLQLPKNQLELFKNSVGDTIEEKLVYFIANYAFIIEINTAKSKGESYNKTTGELEQIYDEDKGKYTQYYSDLTVPGGTNYTENEIATPAITPAIKGHAQFSTDNGIGWFRSDDKTKEGTGRINEWDDDKKQRTVQNFVGGEATKTRRILEVQDDWLQKLKLNFRINGINYSKGTLDERDGKYYLQIYSLNKKEKRQDSFTKTISKEKYDRLKQTSKNNIVWLKGEIGEEQAISTNEYFKAYDEFIDKGDILAEGYTEQQRQFAKLLANEEYGWDFRIKAIIQDSAKKGYEKVLFPKGDTASKIEGHSTLEEFKKQKEDRLKELEDSTYAEHTGYKLNNGTQQSIKWIGDKYYLFENYLNQDNKKEITKKEFEEKLKNRNIVEINQLKQELERVETEGFAALRPIYKFYEETVGNILKKQFKNQIKEVTDEFGNSWLELSISLEQATESIKFQSPKLEYIGDLAIEEEIMKMIENSPDKIVLKSLIHQFFLKIKQWLMTVFNNQNNINNFIKDVNDGKFANIQKPIDEFGKEKLNNNILNTKEFTDMQKFVIINNFASKHELTEEQAINTINEALIIDEKRTIEKLKSCYNL